MILEWHKPLWQRVLDNSGRMHHALLLNGPAGGGKRAFAEALAARTLCVQPDADGQACGRCEDCQWRLAGSHPDFMRIIPEADQNDTESSSEKTGETKAASRQIVIDQIRDLQQSLTTGGHRGGQRVVIVDPAEAMNLYTANALLKLLEEPTTSTLFLLITSTPKRLLPTIRSRCQSWTFPRPPADAAVRWLDAQQIAEAPALLAFAGGMPLAAAALATGGGAAALRRFTADIAGLPGKSALRLAGEWDAWLKSKEAQGCGLDMPTLTLWLQRWVGDLASVCLGGPLRFFPDSRGVLQSLAERLAVDRVLGCYNDVTQSRRVAQHPLNARLFLEDMLLRYARAFSTGGARTGGGR